MNTDKNEILIVDFGSQYTLLISRMLTEIGFNSLVIEPDSVDQHLESSTPKAIILSGGDKSVYDKDAPTISSAVFSGKYFVLGICYGMQLIAFHNDKTLVKKGNESQKGYGPVSINLQCSELLFANIPETFIVWASHGDIVHECPDGFTTAASSFAGNHVTIEAIQSDDGKIFGVQFHPEVDQTQNGSMILKNFIELAGCELNWKPKDIIVSIQEEVISLVGNGKAFIGVSGGVDSTTVASILAPVLGKKLYACLIDHGGMREGEVEEVCNTAKQAGIDLHVISATEHYFATIGEAVDPEEKRKRFQKAYVETFEQIIRDEGITHIIQGTLKTDLIESGKSGKSAHIKSHHNVGLEFSVPQIEPFRDLFKYQVRKLARLLELNTAISERKPFPGPGLYLRVLGVPATPQHIDTVRFADNVVSKILKSENCYNDISQIIVALNGIETVGIKGDARSMAYSIIVRTVRTKDFMTVEPVYLSPKVMEKITSEITKHPSINRVFWDYTPKPPATTEFQ